MRLLKVWTAVVVVTAIVTATGCGGSNMSPAAGAGKMDHKMMSDSNMMSNGKMMDGKMMDGKMMDGKMMDGKMMDGKMSGAVK